MHANKPQVFNYFSLPWQEAGVEGEGDKIIKNSSKSSATSFYVGIVFIRGWSLKHRASGCPAVKSSCRAPVCWKGGALWARLRDVTQCDPDLMAWEMHRRNQTSCLLLGVSGAMFVSDPLSPGFPHARQKDADTGKGMVHLTLQVSDLGLNGSHPEYFIHWLKRDYSIVDVCVISINISSKEPIGLSKVSLWWLPSVIILATGICMALHTQKAKGGTGNQKPSFL